MNDMKNNSNEIAKQSVNHDTINRKSKASLLLGLGLGLAVVLTGFSSCGSKSEKGGGKTDESEIKAYEACASVADYRAYMKTYGSNGKFYKEAKNVVDRYVADSITKAQSRERTAKKEEAAEKEEECYNKCTTIEACETYLKEYPNGKYVKEVKEKKKELEDKAAKARKEEDDMYNKCTTIEGCNNYLRAYPQGRYVSQVAKKKAELEKKENSGKNKVKIKDEKNPQPKTKGAGLKNK